MFSMRFMSCATQLALKIQRKLAKTRLSRVDVVILLQMAKDMPSYFVPLLFCGDDSRKPSSVAPRIGSALFAVDALFRVTMMFPTVTNPDAWWTLFMSNLNLEFSYSTFRSHCLTSLFIEQCRQALKMYSQRRRPSPYELHRLFNDLNTLYSRRKHSRRLRRKTSSAADASSDLV